MGLVLRKLDYVDYLFLLGLFIALIVAELNRLNILNSAKIGDYLCMSLFFAPWVAGLRLKNILFSLVWGELIFLFIFFVNSSLMYLPVIGFIYYHILRYIFWKKYKIEFIPLLLRRYFGFTSQFSKLEQRQSTDEDKIFSFILWVGGIILISISFELFMK